MTPDFLSAFERVIGHEGGYQCDPKDRGNWTGGKVGEGELKGTKYGISAAAYPQLDIKNLRVEDAQKIYWRDYWEPLGLSSNQAALTYQLFDSAINHGISATVKMLQKIAGVKVDGVMGTKTKRALATIYYYDLLALFLAERLEYMVNASTWDIYGEGWAKRIAKNLRYIAADTTE